MNSAVTITIRRATSIQQVISTTIGTATSVDVPAVHLALQTVTSALSAPPLRHPPSLQHPHLSFLPFTSSSQYHQGGKTSRGLSAGYLSRQSIPTVSYGQHRPTVACSPLHRLPSATSSRLVERPLPHLPLINLLILVYSALWTLSFVVVVGICTNSWRTPYSFHL